MSDVIIVGVLSLLGTLAGAWGGTYIAAKSGFMLVGVIMPYNIIEKGFVEQVESLAKQCRVAFEAKERARAVAAEDQQQTTII